MNIFRVRGGKPLCGTVAVSGSKNASLPIMAAAILSHERCRLEGVPQLLDVQTLLATLRGLGLHAARETDGAMVLETVDSHAYRADPRLVRRMRASFCVLGPLLARRGRALVPLPGGCQIGRRPVDLHLKGLAALGAEIRIRDGWVRASAPRLRGATIDLGGPRGPTVTGTANVLSAATLARGKTLILGAACEPEIIDLGHFLIAMGARIDGLGTPAVEIHGADGLGGATHRIIPDRIEAATLLIAAAITGGRATARGANAGHLASVLRVLDAAGCCVQEHESGISLVGPARPKPFEFTARPYPDIPTDVQSQLIALAALAPGRSVIRDRVFPHRFAQVAQLNCMGASIERVRGGAVVRGVNRFVGADVAASDLRASAALVLAALAAEGETTVRRVKHLDRGYERLETKLAALGATIEREDSPDTKPLQSGMIAMIPAVTSSAPQSALETSLIGAVNVNR